MSSLFRFSREGSVFESAISQGPPTPVDLITFLEIAQKLDIDLLPVRWQPALERIGFGGSGEIREASLSRNDSFAFKRAIPHGVDTINNHVLPFLIAEISILGHHSVRDHPNINRLQGVCWDIYSPVGHRQVFSRKMDIDPTASAIIPVLVFEKTVHGDLHQFMEKGPGRKFSLSEKLQLAADIAQAVADMHSNSECTTITLQRLFIINRYHPW